MTENRNQSGGGRGVGIVLAVLCALLSVYWGLHLFQDGNFLLDHGQNEEQPKGYLLAILGFLLILPVPGALIVLSLRRRRS